MGAAYVLALTASLVVVGDPGSPRPQIGDEFIELSLVRRLGALPLQHSDRSLNIPTPQSSIEPTQQLRFGQLAPADPAAEFQAFLSQMMPIQEHGLVRDRSEGVSKEAADPAC